MTEQERYWIWLSSINGVGASLFYRILGIFMDAQTACENHADIARKLKLPDKLAANIKKAADKSYWDSLFEKNELPRSRDYGVSEQGQRQGQGQGSAPRSGELDPKGLKNRAQKRSQG